MSRGMSVTLGSWSFGGLGLAVGLSWHLNHSVTWAILHGLLGWVYVGFKAGGKLARALGY